MPSWEKAESSFMTSLDIVQEVMNVPMCALTSLLRSYGYDSIDDTSSLCIDEKRLEIFADPTCVKSEVILQVLFAILAS